MKILQVSNLSDVLPKSFFKDKKLVSVQNNQFTAAGENYGSSVISIVITLQHDDSQEQEEINTVAKLLPPNQFIRNFMNSSYTFRNELGFYQTILPTLRLFQKEQTSVETLDFFPKFLGGRLSLDSSARFPDDNAIILLENLKDSGFELHDRHNGFDLEATKLILKRVAELHGVALALKTTPEFEQTLSLYFEEFRMFGGDDGLPMFQVLKNKVIKVLEEDEFCRVHMDRIRLAIDVCTTNLLLPKNVAKFRQDTFATFIHSDLWINNIMVRKHQNKIEEVKFLDMQLCEYASITKDLLFFLFTSVENSVLTQSFDQLLSFYYNELKENLEKMKCYRNEFSFDALKTEMRDVASNIGYFNIIRGMPAVFGAIDVVYEAEDLNRDRLLHQLEFSEVCKTRICLITREFIHKRWI
ncbi:hypothetical protein Zmor_010109 [Zophobas morio]|uniref:CHK kinase-like domain-containing protein n=1 Tax=Zophobas morio TaxID=2755281 RepID=A0AA38IN67_9CUCU|nr:hypothetical protein Zmor_010109 [Zophobas morio]